MSTFQNVPSSTPIADRTTTKPQPTTVAILDNDEKYNLDVNMTELENPSTLLISKSDAALEDDEYEFQYLDSTGPSRAKSLFQFFKPKIVTMVQLSSRALALIDMATDINLLYKSQSSNNGALTVILFLSICSPYLLQYSCGIKLFTLNRTFERLKGLKKVLVVLFLLPFGVFFFIFLDLFDIFFNFYVVIQLLFCCSSLADIQRTEEDVATQLGMDRMNWEGIKRQKKVAQLMFETIPQVTLQVLLFFEIIPGVLELTGGITEQDILLSCSSAIANALLEMFKLYMESKAVEEGFFNYALTCFMARIGWIPFRFSIRKFLENPNAKLAYISYNIRFMFVSVDFFFSELTIHQLIETLLIRPLKKDGYDSIIIIDFHESLRLLTVNSLVELLRICSERHIFIKGLNDTNKLNWNDVVLESMENDNDVRLSANSRDSQGTSHLVTIYKSEKLAQTVYSSNRIQKKLKELSQKASSKDENFLKIAFLPTIFSQCIALDFDINVSSLQNGETLIFELIRNNDYTNLWYLLNEYQTTRNCDVYLDIRNKQGRSPLYYSLKQYIRLSKDKRKGKKKKKVYQSPVVKTLQSPGGAVHEIDATMFNIATNLGNLNRDQQTGTLEMTPMTDMTRNLSEPLSLISGAGGDVNEDNKMYMLLLKSGASPNFPVLKKSGLTQSSLGYLLENEELEIILEVIPFDAELNSKEIVRLSKLFIPKSVGERVSDWRHRKHLLIKICTKLQIPLDYIRDENQCNPLHLLLKNEEFYSYGELELIINELQNVSLNWIFQHDENGNLPIVGILRDNNPNINVFKMVYDNTPTDSHRKQLITILKSNRYTIGIIIYFIINETRKLVQFINCEENKNIKSQLIKIFNIFGEDIRWNAKDHNTNVNKLRTVRQWLGSIGKEKYFELFIENDFNDMGKIKHMDKTILNEIGIDNEHDIFDIINGIKSMNKDLNNNNKDKIDLSIVSVLSEDIYMDDYMRYKIANKLSDEFNLLLNKNEEIILRKWNKKAVKKSLMKMQTTRKLIEKELEEKSNIITEMKNWIGRIDKQITKQITKRQQKYVIGRIPTEIDGGLNEIKEDGSDSDDNDEQATRGTIISLQDTNRLKTRKHVETNTFKKIFWERLELVYAFMVEGLSVMDLTSDVVILLQLLRSPEQWWTAWMLLFLLSPYLVSFCALASIFQSHTQVTNKELNRFAILMFLSPFSVLFLLFLDIIFMFYVIVALILTLPLLMCCCNIRCIDSDWIFRLFGMTQMETKGYRRLRTLSQLIFETIPQICLQARMLYALKFEQNTTKLTVTTDAVIASVIIAAIHFILEVMVISAEANATKVTLFQYGITCLNARLNWVPLSHLLHRHQRNYQQKQRQKALRKQQKKKKDKKKKDENNNKANENLLNFEELSHRVCKINYQVNYEFSASAMRRLAGYVTRMQTYVDLSSNDVTQIGSLLAAEYSTIPRITLGEKSCQNLSLLDLATLYRNGAHRLVIEGGESLEWNKLVGDYFVHLMEDGEVDSFEFKKVKFLMHDFLIHGELNPVHEMYTEIEIAHQRYLKEINIQELKQSLLSLQGEGGICKDIATMRRFWRNKYMFGLQCEETHKIYKVILNYYEKALTLYQSMSNNNNYNDTHKNDEMIRNHMNSTIRNQYYGILNMILLILWYSQGTILNHRCPECNMSWREYIDKNTKSQYRINLIKQLPENVKLFVKTIEEERSGIFNQNKKVKTIVRPRVIIPFILCECSGVFSKKIDNKIMKNCKNIGDKLFSFDDEDDSDDKIRENSAIWSWLDINEKDSTGTYHRYEHIVNKDINEKIANMSYSNRPTSRSLNAPTTGKLLAQKTVDAPDMDGGGDESDSEPEVVKMDSTKYNGDEKEEEKENKNNKIMYIKLTQGQFALEEYKEQGDFFIKIDMNNIPWKYYEIIIDKNGKEIKSKPVKKVTSENSINMIVLKDSKSGTDRMLGNLKQRDVDMLSTVIENKHDATNSYIIMKNLYKQNLLKDLLSTAVFLKLKHGYNQVLVAISRFFVKKTIDSSFSKNEKRINVIFNYREAEDSFKNLSVLGIERLHIILKINDELNRKSLDKMDEENGNVIFKLWMKIPNENKIMLKNWNNVLISKQKIDIKNMNKKAIKFQCDLHECFALGYFNPSLLNKNKGKKKEKNIEFYIEMSSDLSNNIEIIESKCQLIVNQTISETKFEKVHSKYTKEHSIPKWEYLKDGKWSNYEKITCIQMEESLKKILKKRKENKDFESTIIIPIKKGNFFSQSQNKNTYQIRIVCSVYPPRMYQLNVKTGHTRLVKQDPPYWINIEEQILEDPYKIKWKYQHEAEYDDDDDVKEKCKYIYVDITEHENDDNDQLTLQERIEEAYQQHLKRFKFSDGYSEKTIHFNYDSIPHTFIETDHNFTNDIKKVIRQNPLFLRKMGLESKDLIIKMGPFWELIKPCSIDEYMQLVHAQQEQQQQQEIDIENDDDEFDYDIEIDDEQFIKFENNSKRIEKQQCLLCKCNMEEWEILENQLKGNNIFKQKHQYKMTIENNNINKTYDMYCEYISNNTIVSIKSGIYFHSGCITEYFDKQLFENENKILKCPKTDTILYDISSDDCKFEIGSKIEKYNYEMIVNKNEKLNQIQILFVFGEFVSPVTHAIKYDDYQLLQDYKDAFRRRLIIFHNQNIIYKGKNQKLIKIFNPPKQINNNNNNNNNDDNNNDISAEEKEIDDDILNALVSDVIMQKTVTYGDDDNKNNDNDSVDSMDIQAMIDKEMDLSDDENKDNNDNNNNNNDDENNTQENNEDKNEHYNTKTVKFIETETVIEINDDDHDDDDGDDENDEEVNETEI